MLSDFWFDVPALSWELPTTATPPENRRKSVRVPPEIAKKHIENAVKEVLRVDRLPENTTVDGSLYQSGGAIILHNAEFPPSVDGKIQDITPGKKD